MYNYLSNLVFYLILGMLIGVLDAWKRKLMFLVWFIAVVFIVVMGFINGINGTDNLTGNLLWYQWFYQVGWIIIGMLMGKVIYKGIFNKKRLP